MNYLDLGIECSVPSTRLSTVGNRAFPVAAAQHGTVCQSKWLHQITCKPSKPN